MLTVPNYSRNFVSDNATVDYSQYPKRLEPMIDLPQHQEQNGMAPVQSEP